MLREFLSLNYKRFLQRKFGSVNTYTSILRSFKYYFKYSEKYSEFVWLEAYFWKSST